MKPVDVIVLLTLATGLGACGDPFSQPSCYYGPGCGEDKVPPIGEFADPVPGVVRGNFFVTVTATDNIGILGVEFFLNGIQFGTMVTRPPYRMLIDPTRDYVPPAPSGPRDVMAIVHDLAQNTDTLYLTVNYSP